jgi:hypothetical protein
MTLRLLLPSLGLLDTSRFGMPNLVEPVCTVGKLHGVQIKIYPCRIAFKHARPMCRVFHLGLVLQKTTMTLSESI